MILLSCSRELMAPTSVFLSSGSPMRSVETRACSFSSSSSATDSCTSSREPAQHTWPWLKKMPLTMPSTAWSSGASSNTTLAALPPSSRVSFLPDPASERWISLPTSVEPVNATLSTPGWLVSSAPTSPAPGRMLTTPGGRSACWMISASTSAVSGVVSAGLSTTVLPQASAGRDLPRGHQQREVPRDDLAGHAERARVGAEPRVAELVRPARVVEEVRRRGRHVDVAGLLDRLAVVQALQHGQLAGPLGDHPRDPEDVLGPLGAGHLAPHPLVGPPRGLHRAVHIGRCGRGHLGQHLLGGRVDRLQRLAAALDELAVEEHPVAGLEVRDVPVLGRGRVLPQVISHVSPPSRSPGRCSGPRVGRGAASAGR